MPKPLNQSFFLFVFYFNIEVYLILYHSRINVFSGNSFRLYAVNNTDPGQHAPQ